MDSVTFKKYKFYYEPQEFNYFINENNLTFFHSEYEVGVHVSMDGNKLFLRPRYGVTIQKLAKNAYQIISNSN